MLVFGIYSAKTVKSRIYTWPETKARRGVNEVVSCLDDYITKHLDPTVRNLHVFTDECRGQNHNNTMVQYLHSLVLNKRLDSVTHRLPMRGHSYLPCDREFGAKSNLKIITCEDMNAIQEQKFHLLKSSFRNIVYPTDSLYTEPCAINSKKVKDVQSLARYLLREDSRDYMKSLTEKIPCGMAGGDSDYEE